MASFDPMSSSHPSSVWLEPAGGERVHIQGRCFLGRSPSCQVVLPDTKVSRQHALVEIQDQTEVWLIDLGSANGTYLNGRRVTQPCRLSDGDRIEVAGFSFTFHGPKVPGAVRSDPSATEATIHQIRSLTCWLLLADIEGSTQLLLKVPAEDAPRVTGRWLAACREILEAHNGAINKYLGDGFLAYWPAGPESPAWVARSLLALKKLQEEEVPHFRIVVHYGTVSTGGAASMGEESLSGNEVNFIFRVEKLAASKGEFRLLTEPAQTQLELLLPSNPTGPHPVPGFEGEFSFFSF
jgi:adenylate cyclase